MTKSTLADVSSSITIHASLPSCGSLCRFSGFIIIKQRESLVPLPGLVSALNLRICLCSSHQTSLASAQLLLASFLPNCYCYHHLNLNYYHLIFIFYSFAIISAPIKPVIAYLITSNPSRTFITFSYTHKLN